MTKTKANKEVNVYQMVTDRIIAELENGVIPWRKPWVNALCARGGDVSSKYCAVSYATGKPYSFLNQMMLSAGEYITFKQAKAAGGHVKKGAEASQVVFWKMYRTNRKDADGNDVLDDHGEPVKTEVPILKYYNVFHLSDCEGLDPKWEGDLDLETDDETGFEPDFAGECFEAYIAEQIAENYLDATGIQLIHEIGSRAFYRPGSDEVHLPMKRQFTDIAGYYGTMFHELVHSTGHSSRLNRIERAKFGDEKYSREELIAEIGSAALVNYCGLETEDAFKNSASYIDSWLTALRNDNRAIVTAGGKAQKAVDLILSYTVDAEESEQEAA